MVFGIPDITWSSVKVPEERRIHIRSVTLGKLALLSMDIDDDYDNAHHDWSRVLATIVSDFVASHRHHYLAHELFMHVTCKIKFSLAGQDVLHPGAFHIYSRLLLWRRALGCVHGDIDITLRNEHAPNILMRVWVNARKSDFIDTCGTFVCSVI